MYINFNNVHTNSDHIYAYTQYMYNVMHQTCIYNMTVQIQVHAWSCMTTIHILKQYTCYIIVIYNNIGTVALI